MNFYPKLLFILFFLSSTLLNAQELIELSFSKKLELGNDNQITSSSLTSDGHYIITGYTFHNSKGGKDIWIAKLTLNGEIVWQKNFGDINNDEGTSIIESIDGNYVAVANSINPTSGYTEAWFLKLDLNGKLLTHTAFKMSSYFKLNDIKNFDKSSFIVCGVRKETGNDDNNFLVMKINQKGVKLWQQEVGSKYFEDEANSVIVTQDNEIIVVGFTTNENKEQHTYIVKLDATGKIFYDEKIGDIGKVNNITSIEETLDKKLILAGYTSVNSNGEEDALIMIFDKSKKLILKKSFGKSLSDKLISIKPYKGGYLAVGTTKSIKDNSETLYIVKLDFELNVIWERFYLNNEGSSFGNDIVVDKNYFTVFGSTETNKLRESVILNYKDNSDDFISTYLAENPTVDKNKNELQLLALEKQSVQNNLTLLDKVVEKEFEDVTYRGSGDPLKGLNVSKSLDDLKVGNYYALIIGIDKYSGTWNPLKNAVNDAKTVESVLKAKYKFNHFKSLYNENATRENIINALEWLLSNAKPDDNVFIYYSGHGEFKKDLNKGYWVPFGATTNSTSNYISNSDLQTFINGIQSKHTLLVADACFSGDIFRGNTISVPFENSPKYFKKVHSLKSRQAMTSGGIEPVMDGGKDGHSVFAYYLLKALKENNAEMMDASQIFNSLKIPVYNNSDQSPDFKPISKSGDEGGQFIFMKK